MNENFENGNELENIQQEAPGLKKSILLNLYEWLEVFAVALCAVAIIFTFFARVVTVVGTSMTYTLSEGERLVVSDVLYEPKTGDIVILHLPGDDEPLVKRVIATEGQSLEIDFDSWTVTVDGEVLSEPYVRDDFGGPDMARGSLSPEDFPLTVPDGCVFVMGDNRNNSRDSRMASIGFIEERYIVGRVLFRLFPLSKFGKI